MTRISFEDDSCPPNISVVPQGRRIYFYMRGEPRTAAVVRSKSRAEMITREVITDEEMRAEKLCSPPRDRR